MIPTKHWRAILVTILLLNYVSVGLAVPFLHDHDFECRFHDDCPACHWQIQSQEDNTTHQAILDGLSRPFILIGYLSDETAATPLAEVYFSDNLSRAPPVIL